MRHGRAIATVGAMAVVAMTAACASSPTASGRDAAASSAARTTGSASSTAAPGTYGTPVDPSLPNPTGVATDSAVPSASADTVPVVITYAGWTDSTAAVEVGGYVAGVAESGGRCTLTLTSGSGSASAEVPAEPDASSTACPTLIVAGSQLSPGTWEAVVSYASATTSGKSDPVEVVVP